LPAKTILASPVLTAENTGFFSTNWQKLANPDSHRVYSGIKTDLKLLVSVNYRPKPN